MHFSTTGFCTPCSLAFITIGLLLAKCPLRRAELPHIEQEEWGRVWHGYKMMHERLLANGSDPGVGFIVGTIPPAGIGNRMMAEMAVLLLALATNRIALFNSSMDFNNHFEPDVDLRWSSYRQKLNSWGMHEPTLELSKTNLRNLEVKNLTEEYGEHRMWGYTNIGDNVAFFMFGNEVYKPWFQSLPSVNLFSGLAPYLFKPSQPVRKEVEELKFKDWRRLMIGIQVRYGHLRHNVSHLPDLADYFRVAKTIASQADVGDEDIGYFIASDVTETYQATRKFFGVKNVFYADNGIANADPPVRRGHGTNPGTPLSAMVDLAMLSECDYQVITQGSTFGYMSATMAGKRPYILTHGPHNNTVPRAFQALTTEPGSWIWKGHINSLAENEPEHLERLKDNVPMWMDIIVH